MDKISLVKYFIGFLFGMVSVIGLNCNIYSWRYRRFYINYFILIWCLLVIGLFIGIYVKNMIFELISDQMDFKNAVNLYYYINIIGALFNFLSQLVNSRKSEKLLNEIQLFETIKYLDIKNEVLKSSVLFVFVKTILFPIIIEITLILRHLRSDTEQSYLWTLYTLCPLVIANIIPNCLFGSFVISRNLVAELNENLKTLKNEANFLQHFEQIILHKRFYRMQRFCNLADNLDKLAEIYSSICAQTLEYMQLTALPLLASLLCNLFGITAGFFQLYYALADALINEESYDIFNAATNGVFLIISFLEIALHSLAANEIIETVKNTGLILKSIQLDHADIRFKQSVEQFCFKTIVTKFRIQPMGLIDINMAVMNDVLSAVTSFLLILIQTDLTLRFSLK